MPKLFPINIEVEQHAVGTVLMKLHNMPGIAKVNLEMGEPKAKSNGAGYQPKKFEQKAEEYIAELLMKQPMPTSVLRQHFDDVGRRPGSTSSALNVMRKNGDIKHAADGKTWVATKKLKDRLRHRKGK